MVKVRDRVKVRIRVSVRAKDRLWVMITSLLLL